jgi:DNA-binding protein HU-beta
MGASGMATRIPHMADIMNRGDVLDTVAAECDMPSAKVDAVLKAFEGAIGRTLSQGGEVRIAGFGTFKTSARAARTSRNPRTGEPVQVPARTAARFIPGKGLKTAAEGAGSGTGKTSGAVKDASKARADTKAATGEKAAPKAKAAKASAAKAGSVQAEPAKADDGKKAAKTEKAPAKKKK